MSPYAAHWPTFQAIGECMVEITRGPGASARVGYSGDTYNTAVYLARVAADLGVEIQPRFLTGVGDDDESRRMRASWVADGVAGDVIVVPGAAPGLYLISTDTQGERSFAYWRDDSAAARVFAGSQWLERIDGSIVYVSGVSLQLMSEQSRRGLEERLRWLREHGTRVVFDSNFRESAWASPLAARGVMERILGVTDTALVTLDDELALGTCTDRESCAERLLSCGVDEVVIKDGPNGAWVVESGALVRVPTERVDPVDTTAAGDSFNGAYLAARLAGMPVTDAAHLANQVAASVVMQPGAIVAAAQMPVLTPTTTKGDHSA